MLRTMTVATSDALPIRRGHHDHIIDQLIIERAPKLAGNPAWPLLRLALYRLLDYRKARRMADAIAPLPGRAALDYVSDMLGLQVTVRGLERLPSSGRVIVICNHPTGIGDGIAVYDAIKGLRPDIRFYANSDAHRVSPGFDEALIPVEWVEAKRTRERMRKTLTMTREAMEAEQALVIFPAGKLARRQADGKLAESPWMTSAMSLARKYEAPILPLHLDGPWSTLFHFFHGFSNELRDITLFHELLNKRGRAFSLTIGPLVPWDALDADATVATEAMKAYVTGVLPRHPDQPFA
jgi:putative hemolysin